MGRSESVSYEIVRPLGVGGMATVHLANIVDADSRTSRKVAVKRLHDFIANDPLNVAILEDEARLASCIRHPNVVGIIDLIEGHGSVPPVLVMEWVEGVNLAALNAAASASGRNLPLDVTAAIIRDVLAGLHAAHEAKRADGLALEIVHRDVSPHNVLVGFDGVTRITDFGVAKAAWRQQHTELGAIKGKLGYMAPEQLEGHGDRSADIYGAGVVLWELLTGKRLRTADGEGAQVLVQILQNLVVAPSSLASDPSVASLDALVMRALARDPADRFATANEMLEALLSKITPASNERVAAVVRDLLEPTAPVRSAESRTAPVVASASVHSMKGLHAAGFAAFAATLMGCGSGQDTLISSNMFGDPTEIAAGCSVDADCGPSARGIATSQGEIVSHHCEAESGPVSCYPSSSTATPSGPELPSSTTWGGRTTPASRDTSDDGKGLSARFGYALAMRYAAMNKQVWVNAGQVRTIDEDGDAVATISSAAPARRAMSLRTTARSSRQPSTRPGASTSTPASATHLAPSSRASARDLRAPSPHPRRRSSHPSASTRARGAVRSESSPAMSV